MASQVVPRDVPVGRWPESRVTSDSRRVVQLIHEIATVADAYYIGRTNWPEKRLLGHRAESGRQHLAVLQWASSIPWVRGLEIEMIKMFRGKKGNENVGADSDGGLWGRWNCVYVAWNGDRLPPSCDGHGVHHVLHLDGPDVPPHHEERLDVFHTSLSRSEAASLVRWKSRPARR